MFNWRDYYITCVIEDITESKVGWTDKELHNITAAYDNALDNELIPTEPSELKRYLSKQKARNKRGARRQSPPGRDFGDLLDVTGGTPPKPLLTLTEATIEMMDNDSDGWSEALNILYGGDDD